MSTFYNLLSQIRPIIKAAVLEKMAGIPDNALGKHYRYADGLPDGKPCPEKHFPAIVRALCGIFGVIEIDIWRITCDPDGPAIFAIRPIPGRDVECTETENGFEYLQPEWRQVYDDFDFYTYFK